MRQQSIPNSYSWPVRVWAFVKLGRPIFLFGGVVMHALGVGMALYDGVQLSQQARLDLRALVLAQIAVSAAQLMTHYLNDYFDVDYDRANSHATNWSGGSRVLVDGTLPPAAALIAAVALGAISLGAGGLLAISGRALILPIILAAVILAVAYSTPPIRLHARGLGELTAAIIVAGLTPLVGYVAQRGAITPLPFVAALPLICFQMAMLIGVAFPDALGDAQSGKRTLVVRLGQRANRLYLGLIAAGYALLIPSVMLGMPLIVALAMLGSLPVAARLAMRVLRGAWREARHHDSLAFGGIALLMCAAVLEFIGFLAAAGS